MPDKYVCSVDSAVGERASLEVDSLSLPTEGFSPAGLVDKLTGVAKECLESFDEKMLVDATEWGRKCDEVSDVL